MRITLSGVDEKPHKRSPDKNDLSGLLTAVEYLLNVTDILFYLAGCKLRRTGIGIIFEDETHLTNIVANTSGRVAANSHYLLKL